MDWWQIIHGKLLSTITNWKGSFQLQMWNGAFFFCFTDVFTSFCALAQGKHK